jgi:membrane protease YdiL (CAAX protease family)
MIAVLIPFLLIIFAVINNIYKIINVKYFNYAILLTSLILAFNVNVVDKIGFTFGFAILVGLAIYKYIKNHYRSKALIYAWQVVFCFVVILSVFHFTPGFNNILVFDKILLSPSSSTFTMYFNYDKLYTIGAIFVILYQNKVVVQNRGILITLKQIFSDVARIFPFTFIFIIGLAYLFKFIAFDLKLQFDTTFYIFALNNLLIVCLMEEVLYRFILTTEIKERFTQNKTIIILLTSFIFALSHLPNVPYAILALASGIFYSLAYLRNYRIESSILLHFLINIIHFVFFSYPFLALPK